MTMDEWNKDNKRTIDVDPRDIKYVDHPEKNEVRPGQGGQPGQPGQGGQPGGGLPQTANSSLAPLSLFFGIASIVLGLFLGGAPWVGVLSGTAAIVSAAVDKKRKNVAGKKMSTAGLVCGIIGVCVSIFVGIVLWFIVKAIQLWGTTF
ncbi:MAG: hypothetical protein K6A74_05570 [Lachnospiraceae bacterium]|nr:hypothetical protein [Lachnospiraceae bacterium]